MTKTITVRDLTEKDSFTWATMWYEYCGHFAHRDRDSFDILAGGSTYGQIMKTLWGRLMDPNGSIRGLVVEVDGNIAGFCHYVLHVHSWGTGMLCHAEDLFVREKYRDSKAGTALLNFLRERGKESGWDRIYGSTDTDNTGARRLYERFAKEEDRRSFQIVLKDYGWHE